MPLPTATSNYNLITFNNNQLNGIIWFIFLMNVNVNFFSFFFHFVDYVCLFYYLRNMEKLYAP